ncbi:HPr kinase/phosphatase C-terminal domain-containing protein [Tsuneonella sp. YG55]|uniref:HPr kinase/phosphatase C-terminal domain-containing protein n=1 Tax=Tsuneonella litorea TaxID=2976475 RepID=A0A9X2W2B2_9SPHN|nr:HPr kinase/phosphatase C-terminal domain-containing protein [Tsuneonella litorea]MCT2558581.1 HPr kinase/phosphatase C-terminal domain-containing protein [Tsuneonella litorea]
MTPAVPSLHQATAVAIGGRGLLIEGPPGCGKTTLALTLIDRGATLIGDDGVRLHAEAGVLLATPPSATAGLIEVRGVGIATLPTTGAPVALVLRAHDVLPRFVEGTGTVALAGCAIPLLAFDLRGPAAALRAEYALAMHGLSPGKTA